MIHHDRFICSQTEFEQWKQARVGVVTATQVSKAATPAGFSEAVAELHNPTEVEDNPYMEFGRNHERWVTLTLKNDFGIFPNDWLIAGRQEPWHTATPDGLSLDHTTIAEVKTTGRDWGSWAKVPIHYRRQVQWQLHVTEADKCVFAWLLRAEGNDGRFVPAWWEPKVVVVPRDEEMITHLIAVADQLHEVTKGTA
jgi:hypothetical protein